jgi:ABC-type transport system involved in cytochrome bd biosynthesis fused ATPase/permease subunit
MSLQRIYTHRVFDDATTDERRAHVYVRSGELGLQDDSRADVVLMDALVTQEPPQRVHVVGPSGAGKTSLVCVSSPTSPAGNSTSHTRC